jgi:hypothetical protein
MVWGHTLSCRRTAFHNKTLMLLWPLVPWILSTKFPYDSFNEFISHKWVSSLTTFVVHIGKPIPEFSAPFSHTTVTYNIITVYTTQSMMNLGRTLSFCMKKTNHSTYLMARRTAMIVPMFHQQLLLHYAAKIYDSRHSVITNVTCYCWACNLSLWQRVSFYQPIRGWFWNFPCTATSASFTGLACPTWPWHPVWPKPVLTWHA